MQAIGENMASDFGYDLEASNKALRIRYSDVVWFWIQTSSWFGEASDTNRVLAGNHTLPMILRSEYGQEERFFQRRE